MTDDNSEEDKLDTGFDHEQRDLQRGEIRGMINSAFRFNDVEQSTARFEKAKQEQWNIEYAVVTSGAHGWQIVNEDDQRYLEESAYADDISKLVFENGWIMRNGARWIKDNDLAREIVDKQERVENISERINDEESDRFKSDDRFSFDTDASGNEMKGWWVFEPTNFISRPIIVSAYAQGYDAAQKNE